MADPIFTPEEHAAEVRPTHSPSGVVRPSDLVELPSRGKLYTSGPLADKSHVEVYYLTAKEEDILTSPNMLQSGKIIDHLLKSVLVDKNIEPSQLLLGDRNAIIVWLRSTGYGSEYPIQIQCGECNKKFEFTFKLADLNIRYLDKLPDSDGLYAVPLPVSKRVARVMFLNAEKDAQVDAMIEARTTKLGGSGNPATSRLLAYIHEVEGVADTDLKQFIETMPAKDSRTVRKFIADNEPTVIMKQDAQCPLCKHLNAEVNVPVTPRFFWPDA